MTFLKAMGAHLRRWWALPAVRVVVGAAVSAVFLALAFRAVPPAQLVATLQTTQPIFVGLTLASIAVNLLAKVIRWRVLLGEAGAQTPFVDLLGSLLVGQMLNTFVPTRVGDLTRAYTVGQRGSGTAFVLGTVLLEKLLDTAAFALLVLAVLLLLPLPPWVAGPAYQVLVVGALLVVTALLVGRRRLPQFVGERLGRYTQHRVASKVIGATRSAWQSTDVFSRPWEVAKLVALSAVVWGTAILNNYLMLWAFGIDLPVRAAMLLLVGLQLGISLPSLPGTIGVFEYVCVVVLALFGVDQTLAFSYGLLLHAVVMIPSTLAGLVFLVLMRGVRRPPLPQQPSERPG